MMHVFRIANPIEAIEFNNLIDSQIAEGKIAPDTLQRFFSAYDYGAASSISWLIVKLKLAQSSLINKSITIEADPPFILQNEDDLKHWISQYLPDILDDMA
jgi:hypothetical protein